MAEAWSTLPSWIVSPPYAAVMVCVPEPPDSALYVSWQLDWPIATDARAQVPPEPKEPPGTSELKLTLPVGVGLPITGSLTKAVHVVVDPAGTVSGLQATVVIVGLASSLAPISTVQIARCCPSASLEPLFPSVDPALMVGDPATW